MYTHTHTHTHTRARARARARIYILDVVKRNPLFLHEIEWKNIGFFFTTSNICIHYICMYTLMR